MIIAISANTSWYLYNFRKNTMLALIKEGYKVIVVCPDNDYKEKIELLGCDFELIRMDRKGKNPFKDLLSLYDFYKVYKKNKVDIVLNFTPKNNIYSTLAAKKLKVKVINNIAGLGVVFIKSNFISKFVSQLYKLSQKKADFIFFQNNEDLELFDKNGIITPGKYERIPGSGVDLSRFEYAPVVEKSSVRFLLVARMIAEKGIYHYVNAAEILKAKYPGTDFCLLGPLDEKNPSGITKAEIAKWEKKGFITYLGFSDNVENYLKEADCVVLPSYYREGVPKSLLEAAAIGRPIITTDNVGCREVVDDGVNGFLCIPDSAMDLVRCIEMFLKAAPEKRTLMGIKSREKAKNEFSEEVVIESYLEKIKAINQKK
ncbi:glycosyltransferase family 4 protein [Pantoea eucrina]|uniref:glycosyltransferase family 4 protein n=1 Tax=Pantoea eucrina TaxID=472693 RepID=UPI002025CA4E|nr:glycosyltransferase family 4 protein [Pantoea eucrina]MCL9647640.1 glycosyltransferase family 4 protein [Pantoea eucrina]